MSIVDSMGLTSTTLTLLVQTAEIGKIKRNDGPCECGVLLTGVSCGNGVTKYFIANRTCNTTVTGSCRIRYSRIRHDRVIFPVIGQSVLSAANQNA